MTDPHDILNSRRAFLRKSTTGVGALALASLLNPDLLGAQITGAPAMPGALKHLDFPAKAKRVIYLFMSGAPSHLDLFDPKPRLVEMTGKDLPDSVRQGQRITGMTSGQKNLFCVGSPFKFQKHGACGMELSELLPHTSKIVDECTFIRSMFTEPINHDPAVTFFGTGSQQPGRPTMGAWLSYGLGSMNENLPAYVVLQSGGGGQPLQSRYWGCGFLPAQHGAVSFRSAGDAVLYVSNPPGIDGKTRRELIDSANDLNRLSLGNLGDPAIAAQIENYELAFRMQTSVPELMDISNESKETFDLYGAKPGQASFASNCILARRLVERGSRFIQLNHRDWDHHGGLPAGLPARCKDVDQASAALVMDLKQRGLLDDTIVIWGGEFGRTAYSQGEIRKDSFGRDHHPRCFTIWTAGGGFKAGHIHGQTDDLGYNIAADPVNVHDFHATLLNRLGVDHKKMVYRHEGRDYRLTDVSGEVVKDLIV
ncbi:MAG TPA: DUF1501 domain-containing protein [Tepidisphaeraceae bacterium]|jgi:hypothetical protein|nr:DUF1501 domain-containing protein [Tepidisphaeraceae bacterium]